MLFSKYVKVLYQWWLMFSHEFLVLIILILLTISGEYWRYSYYHNYKLTDTVKEENKLFDKYISLERTFAKQLAKLYSHIDYRYQFNNDSTTAKSKSIIHLYITIISQRRKTLTNEQYYILLLIWNLVHLDQSRSSRSRDRLKIHFALCNVNSKPEDFTDLEKLSAQFPTFTHYLPSRPVPFGIKKIQKETLDYQFCLNETLYSTEGKHSPLDNYLLMLEDDIIPEPMFYPVIMHFVNHNKHKPFVYLKLYHPPRLLGYLQPEYDRILELFAISSIMTTVIMVFKYKIKRRITLHQWFYVGVCSLLVTLIAGRSIALWLRSIHPQLHTIVPAPFCCTPGMLYSKDMASQVVKQLTKSLSESASKPIDMLIYNFHKKKQLPAWYIQPNLIRHIGRRTSLRSMYINARSL